jgi:acetyl-CoA carboxylase biotin carboxylase subunit
VEHPVTEWVTGLDLVRWQIRIAAGERLTLAQSDVEWRGSALECRVYAEDPLNNFFPSPGTIAQYTEPAGPGVRVDGGAYAGWTVPIEYDPLLAKLTVWADSRQATIDRMRRALAEFHVSGITTNLGLFARLLEDEAFRAGDLHTGLLDEFMRTFAERFGNSPLGDEAVVAAVLAAASAGQKKTDAHTENGSASRWRSEARQGLFH